MSAKSPQSLLFVCLLVFASFFAFRFFKRESTDAFLAKVSSPFVKSISPELHSRLRAELVSQQFNTDIELPGSNSYQVEYTLDSDMQAYVRDYFRIYDPDFGALVVMNAETGEVLVNHSYQSPKIPPIEGVHNLAVEAIVPAASIFKVVTAGASIDLGRISAGSLVAVNGSHHTLYRKNVFNNQINRWTQFVSLKKAFARSINSAFAKIGLQTMEPENLKDYAQKFGFNRQIESDIQKVPSLSSVHIDPTDPWNIASVSSGYDHDSRMSAVHGALLASIAINNGVMMKPRFLKSVKDENGRELLDSKPDVDTIVMTRGASNELRDLMKETIENGTSRRSFRRIAGLRRVTDELEFGGKTGSLDSDILKGRCDWFVGYAQGEKFKYAIAALTVNQRQWKVKSSYLAGRVLEHLYGRHKSSVLNTHQALDEKRSPSGKDL